MQAVILAGGKGTRLASRLNGKPKPLVDVCGVPLLQRQIEQLSRQGVDEFVVLVNHAADQIADFLKAHDDFGSRVVLVDDGDPRGTAGAVLHCLDRLNDSFLVVYGDTLFNIDLQRFLAAHRRSGADASLFLHPNDHPHDSDLVEIDGDGRIVGFHPYPHPEGAWLPNLVNAAFYAVEKRALEPYRDFEVPSDFAKDLFPRLLADGARLGGYSSFEYIKDLGTPARLEKVEKHLGSGLVERSSLRSPQPCVFLDRDGVLNELRDYVRSPEALTVLPGAGRAVRRLNDAGLRAVLVTNQPVIARGECSFEDLRRIHNKLETVLAQDGAFLDRIYFCPHHPHGGFPGERPELKLACDCRKPATGLLEQARRDLNVDLAHSWFIGDSTADLACARAFGLRSILLDTGEGGRDGKYPCAPDFTAADLGAAVDFVLEGYSAIAARLSSLADSIEPGELVLVAGLARSGKSTLAAVLASELRLRGRKAQALSLDRWIRPLEERRPGVLGRYDLDQVRAALGPWLDGGAVESAPAPFYDRFRRTSAEGPALSVAADEVLVLEGVPALAAPFPTARRVRRIHVRLDEQVRAARMQADYRARTGESADAARAVYEARSVDETPVVAGSAASADVTFSMDALEGLGAQ
jgi:histidinol-phosphate phosphatase family protein